MVSTSRQHVIPVVTLELNHNIAFLDSQVKNETAPGWDSSTTRDTKSADSFSSAITTPTTPLYALSRCKTISTICGNSSNLRKELTKFVPR